MAKKLKIRAAQKSISGIKKTNDDCSGIRIPEDVLIDTKGAAIVVADGVSSSIGGREASECCVLGFLNDYYSTPESWTTKKSGEKILYSLNNWLYGEGIKRYGDEYDMVTTLSALVLKSATAHLFHVGDTRVYRLKDGVLTCLTKDHRQRLASSREVLSRAMGIGEELKIDYKNTPIDNGDIFILTTDGVHDFLNDKELKDHIGLELKDIEETCTNIIDHALKKGSDDNITCQLIIVDEVPELSEEEFYKQITELPFPPPLSEGETFEGYKIVRELHSSKKTQVYLAVDIETKHQVVLKTPSINFSDNPEYITAFMNEEWAGKCINNSHILKVVNSERKKKSLYYVTEYIEGKSLRQWMDDNPNTDLTKLRDIIGQIAKGLEALHRKEIIHQDLKPENIMIDNLGTVKIIDFGSVLIKGLEEIAIPLKDNILAGTLNYSAPEAIKNGAGTEQSDIYSLGVIAYEMISGKYPYGKNNSGGMKAKKTFRYKSLCHINEAIPQWVDGAIERSVNTNLFKRHEVPSEFIFELNKPNSRYMLKRGTPLIERDPLMFWKVLALIFGIITLIEFLIIVGK